MKGHRKSDRPTVPAKSPNKGGHDPNGSQGEPQTGTNRETGATAKGEPKGTSEARSPTAEGMEGKGLAQGNPRQQNAPRTPSREGALSALEVVEDGGIELVDERRHGAAGEPHEDFAEARTFDERAQVGE
jgi:hypothetical protein